MHHRSTRAALRSPRGLAVVGLTALLAGCTTAAAQVTASSSPTRSTAVTTSAAAGATTALPTRPTPVTVARSLVLARYRLASGEPYPTVKLAAVRAALQLTTYAAGESPSHIAATVTPDPARRAALVRAAAPLLRSGASSVGTVVYAQMGGITTDQASVMVVVRQVTRAPSTDETRTLDVRLTRTGATWRFDRLASAGGTPVARPTSLSSEARAVLSDRRIWLPDSARWDIYRGAISPTLLTVMEQVAARAPYAVTVLESGHPYDVFGTTHESMHSAGRAVDINTFAGRLVVSQHATGSPAFELVRWLLTRPEVGQVGSPWDLDGAGSRSFTNSVHLDHVHISV
jgi:hypothetical protein